MGVSQSISKKIKAFYCHICRRKKLSLSIRYKSKFQEFLKNKSSHHTTTDPILIRFLKEIRIREKKETELNNSRSQTSASSLTTSSSQQQDHKKIDTKLSHQQDPKKVISTQQAAASPEDFNLQASPTKCYGKSNVSGEDIQNFVSAITKLGYDAAQLATDSSAMDKKPRKISTSDNDDSYSFGVTHKVKKPRNHLESSSQDDSETIDSDIDGFINDDTEDSNDDSQDNDDTDNDSGSSDSSGEGILPFLFFK